MDLKVKRLTDNLSVPELAYATEGSSGLDLHAAVSRAVMIAPGDSVRIPVGYAVEIPEGFEGQVRARSGLAAGDYKIGVTNGIGTIDSDFRGELQVLLTSHANDISMGGKWIMPGEKIAQLVIVPVARVVPVIVDELSDTARGSNGFGSTGNGLDAPAAASALTDVEQAIVAASAALPSPVVTETPVSHPVDTAITQTELSSEDQTDTTANDVKVEDVELTLYDTVNKVLFTGHASKETDTVVAVTEEEADAFAAAGSQDRRVKV
jgi:dUTP pyrophosphatase